MFRCRKDYEMIGVFRYKTKFNGVECGKLNLELIIRYRECIYLFRFSLYKVNIHVLN